MNTLEPIDFNNKSKLINNKIKNLNDIKKIIYQTTNIEVNISKYNSPSLVVSVNNSSAASELHYSRDKLINNLQKYKITKIIIITK